MSLDIMAVEPKGDKKSSDFFNEYRMKIYERRRASGLEDLLGKMRGVVIQVEHGEGVPYLEELYTMSPYRFDCARLNDTHHQPRRHRRDRFRTEARADRQGARKARPSNATFDQSWDPRATSRPRPHGDAHPSR
jgi:hypothetical protein